jgi:hypothetical protein
MSWPKRLAGKLPQEVVRQVYNGKLQSPPMTLDTALSDYAAYKAGEGVRDKDAALRIKKLRKDLKSSLGEHKLEKGSLAEITRAGCQCLSGPLTGADEAQLGAEECGRCKGSRELRDNRA